MSTTAGTNTLKLGQEQQAWADDNTDFLLQSKSTPTKNAQRAAGRSLVEYS